MENLDKSNQKKYAREKLIEYLEVLGNIFGVSKEEYLSEFDGVNFFDKKINIANSDGAIYRPKNGKSSFLITPEKFDNKSVYSEEATHLLRNVFCKNHITDIDEFFGGLGRYLITNKNPKISADEIKKFNEKSKNVQKTLDNLGLSKLKNADLDKVSSYKSALLKEYLNTVVDKMCNTFDECLKIQNSSEEKENSNSNLSIKNLFDKKNLEEKINLEARIKFVDQLERFKLYEDNFKKHVNGYDMVSDVIDSNNTEYLLKKHPNLIRLPNDKIRKIIGSYKPKAIVWRNAKKAKKTLDNFISNS